MANIAYAIGFSPYLAAFLAVLLVSVSWYFWYVYKPYRKFQSCRLEYRIPYWVLKKKNLNYAIMQTFIEHSKRYHSKGVFAAWLGVPILIAYGEEIVKKILNEPTATDKPKFYRLFEFVAEKGILTRNGEIYKKQFKLAAPAFKATAIRRYTTTMNKHAEEMVKTLKALGGQTTDDVINIAGVCTFGILDETNLGVKVRDPELYKVIIKTLNATTELLIRRIWSPWLHFDFTLQFSSSAREVLQLISNLNKHFLKPRLENIKETLISRQASGLDLNSNGLKTIGESFVEQHLQDPTITMEDVTAQTKVLVAAGFDTMTRTLDFALFLLGVHQDAQNRVVEEIISETEGHVTCDDLQRLTYLECVIKETLRLYPPIPLFGRQLNKELECDEYKLPENTPVIVFPYMLHRNPDIFPDPEIFFPERFLKEDSKIKAWNFIPFAEGLRSCIAKHYAMAQMKIILVHVLRNFRVVSLDKMEDVEVSWSAVLHCTKQLRMQFLPRTVAS